VALCEEHRKAALANGDPTGGLVDGYAPFCKHVFLPNPITRGPGLPVGACPINDRTAPLLRSGYRSRRPEELPVLSRWFVRADLEAAGLLPANATTLDVILYHRDQLEKEREALPAEDREAAALPEHGPGGPGSAPPPWGIISIKAQAEDYETPMQPITAMRNALGREEGGSGVPIDRAAYAAAAAYWDKHAVIEG